MSEEKKVNAAVNDSENKEQQYSLNDDRRIKTLSPTAMVMKRFIRNKVAVTGTIILIFMFLFSFVGGVVSPYREDELFYRTEMQKKEYASVIENVELRYTVVEGESFSSVAQAKLVLALQQIKDGTATFEAQKNKYTLKEEAPGVYSISVGNKKMSKLVAIASYDVVSPSTPDQEIGFQLKYDIFKAYANNESSFESEGVKYTLDNGGISDASGKEIGYVSRYVAQALMSDVFLTRDFKEELVDCVESMDVKTEAEKSFEFTDAEGVTSEYTITFNPSTHAYSVLQETPTYKFDSYADPSPEHWLGTDKNGMDMMTRLMYGGRVSLVIGFIVVFIESLLGVVLGGVAGYFGGWVDMLVMRAVDVFYCIPSTPLLIILGAAMDAMRVDPQIRMLYLMLILGFLGWAGVARLVRGQILSLREQEFMTAAEASGIRASRRIFRHLLPNVIPQLIVNMTMGLGGTILTEATLSFLGLGVKFPFASWGNIINDVNNTYVLTTYWFIWIPAGFCLLLTVLAFNLVGDGLRDAFDPKMKR